MSIFRKKIGAMGEENAQSYLIGCGYRILDSNVHTLYGEIDIIALHDETLVFVEVKTRRTGTHGHPLDTITVRKKRAMVKSALVYIKKRKFFNMNYRFDVVAIQTHSERKPVIEIIQNAIELNHQYCI